MDNRGVLIKNANLSKNNDGAKAEEKHLLRFFSIRTSNRNILSVPLHPLGVAPGAVIIGESGVDPVLPGLASLFFSLGNKKKSQGVRSGLYVEGEVHHLDLLLGGKEVPDDARAMNPASTFSGLICFIFLKFTLNS